MKKISGNTLSIELFLHIWFIEMRVEGGRGWVYSCKCQSKKGYFAMFHISTLRLKKSAKFRVLKIKETSLKFPSFDKIWIEK